MDACRIAEYHFISYSNNKRNILTIKNDNRFIQKHSTKDIPNRRRYPTEIEKIVNDVALF